MPRKKTGIKEYRVEDWNIEAAILPDGSSPKRRTTVCPSRAVDEMRERVNGAQLCETGAGACREHLAWMLDKLESEEVIGDEAHRWLGYIQGVLVATHNGSIEDYAALNRRSKC